MSDRATLITALRRYAADMEDPEIVHDLLDSADRIAELDALMVLLRAIAEGYPMRTQDDRYVIVENPQFQPDDGSNPNLVIDCARSTA